VKRASKITLLQASIPQVDSKTGVFVARSGAQVTVNVGTTSVTVPFVGIQLPPPGHPVQMQTVNRELTVTGPARPLPGTGLVVAIGSPRATIEAWGVQYTLPFAGSYTPVLNDQVSIIWSADGGLITGSISAASTVIAPPANSGATVQRYTPPPFRATASGSFGYGGWTKPDVWSSDSFVGAWFGGDKIKDTIPDNAQIISAQIFLDARQSSGDAPRLQVHTSAARPGGTVTFVGAQHRPGVRSGWVPIPTAFIDYLKSNSGWVGVNHGGYTIWKGTQANSLSGAISVVYDA